MSDIILPTLGGEHWKTRAVRACKPAGGFRGGEDMLMVCFLLAVFGWQAGFKPRFGRIARIDKEGMVFSDCVDGYGVKHKAECLGPVERIIDNFRGLADHLKLTDDERIELFSELKKWFAYDARADQNATERGLLQWKR